MTKQPIWKLLANLGDVNPLEHGGFFVYQDETGVYAPEAESLQCDDEITKWTVHRFSLEKCTYQDGVLSDNKFHPDHPAWFARDAKHLEQLGSFVGRDVESLIAGFCSDNAVERAGAYQAAFDFYGAHEFDSYPLTLNRAEAEARIAADRKEIA